MRLLTELPKLARNSGIYIGASALTALISFFLLAYLARKLGAVEFGQIGIFLFVVSVASVLVGANTHGLVSVAYFRDGGDHGAASAMAAALLVMCLSLTILLAVSVGVSGSVSQAIGAPSGAIVIGILCAAAQFLIQVLLSYLQSSSRALLYGTVSVSLSALLALFTVALIELEPTWMARAWGQLISGLVVVGFASVWLLRQLGTSLRYDAAQLVRALKFGVPLVPHSLATVAMSGYDRIFVGREISAAASGQYFAAFQIASVLGLVAAAFGQAWVPWLYARLSEGTHAAEVRVVRVAWGLIAFWLMLAAIITIAARPIVTLVLGPEFSGAVQPLMFLAPSAAVGGVYFLVANTLYYAEKTAWLPVITCLAALIQVAAIHWIGTMYNLVGVAAAVLLSQLFFVAGVWALAQRAYPLPWFGRTRRH